MIVIPSVARDLLFSFLQFLLTTFYLPPPPAVIPTDAIQHSLRHLTSCEMVGLRSGGTSLRRGTEARADLADRRSATRRELKYLFLTSCVVTMHACFATTVRPSTRTIRCFVARAEGQFPQETQCHRRLDQCPSHLLLKAGTRFMSSI